MCTAITLQSRQIETFFGRTMDFSYCIDPSLYAVPQNQIWYSVLNGKPFRDRYAFIGIGQESDGILGFFDGVNERGFAAAVLYFAGYAEYGSPENSPQKEPVASLDFLHYLLGNCGSAEELEELLRRISLVGFPDPVTKAVAPLHWIAADKSGKCAVIEQTGRGLELFRNPIGVMANSPDFLWHMTNLRNYMGVSPEQASEASWGDVLLKPFGQGAGSMLLPGGYTSPERFVRTAYQKTHVPIPESRAEAVITCFHIMESVTVPKGVVRTDRGTYDYTKYTAFLNTGTCEYFFKTHNNNEIRTAGLWEHYNAARLVRITKLNRPVTFEKV